MSVFVLTVACVVGAWATGVEEVAFDNRIELMLDRNVMQRRVARLQSYMDSQPQKVEQSTAALQKKISLFSHTFNCLSFVTEEDLAVEETSLRFGSLVDGSYAYNRIYRDLMTEFDAAVWAGISVEEKIDFCKTLNYSIRKERKKLESRRRSVVQLERSIALYLSGIRDIDAVLERSSSEADLFRRYVGKWKTGYFRHLLEVGRRFENEVTIVDEIAEVNHTFLAQHPAEFKAACATVASILLPTIPTTQEALAGALTAMIGEVVAEGDGAAKVDLLMRAAFRTGRFDRGRIATLARIVLRPFQESTKTQANAVMNLEKLLTWTPIVATPQTLGAPTSS